MRHHPGVARPLPLPPAAAETACFTMVAASHWLAELFPQATTLPTGPIWAMMGRVNAWNAVNSGVPT